MVKGGEESGGATLAGMAGTVEGDTKEIAPILWRGSSDHNAELDRHRREPERLQS
jgi:hypothetical protein